jgi:hypothetical protein
MKYLKITVFCFLIASVFSLIGVFVLQSTGLIGKADSDFKNLPCGIAMGINLCFFLGSFTILLNLKEYVRTNLLYKALSFFLLPGIIVLFVLLRCGISLGQGCYFAFLTLLYYLFFSFGQKKYDIGNFTN